MWFDSAASAAHHLFTLGPMLGWLIILPFAVMSGLIPGGGLPVSAVLLSLVGVLDPWVALTVLVFNSGANDVTEPVPAIMLGIPGSRSSQATILDGYPMARQGRAGVALGASYMTGLLGGVIGAVVLLASLPIGRLLLLSFGSAEFMLLALMGVIAVGIVSAGAFAKGMLTAMLGFAIAVIGWSPIEGGTRVTLGIGYLWDGAPLVPIVVGLFALPEIIDLVTADKPISAAEEKLLHPRRDVMEGMKIALRNKSLILRSSLVGVLVGIMPALGGGPAHWIAYAQARATVEGAKQTFGRGDVRGVIASDAANNSSDGGELVPTLVFGIPGSGAMSILLAMLILYGIRPGPDMLTTHLDLTLALVFALAAGNVVVVPIMVALGPVIIKVATIPPNLLAPVVIAIVTISAYMATYSLGDLGTVLGFAVLGIFMKRYGWPRPPVLIALVLGEQMERSMHAAVRAYGMDMFARPQFLIILTLMLLLIIMSLKLSRGAREEGARAGDEEGFVDPPIRTGLSRGAHKENANAGDEEGLVGPPIRKRLTAEILGEMILLVVIAAFFLYIFASSFGWTQGGRLMPRIVLAVGTPFLILRFLYVLRVLFRIGQEPRLTTRTEIMVMDLGFRVSDDPKGVTKRWIRIVSAIVILYLGIWLVGFFIALPLWTFIYMRLFGRGNPIISGGIALLLLGILLGIYDYFIRVPWHAPLLRFPTVVLFLLLAVGVVAMEAIERGLGSRRGLGALARRTSRRT